MNDHRPALPDHVRAEVDEQRHALRDRVEASGLYRHEPDEFEVAAAALTDLWPRLGVADDLGSLTTVESRNLVRRVRLRDGTVAALKVIGNTREPGEGELLTAWHRVGLPCVRPLAWGYARVRCDGDAAVRTASYLLTELVSARPLPEPRDLGECVRRASDLVALIRPFHLADVRISRARSWADRLRPHLRETLPMLHRRGLDEPREWEAKLDRLSRDGRTVVHGDPAGRNVLDSGHGLVLLDPPGALVALPEADVAQICCQVAGADGAAELLAVVAGRHPELDPSALAGFAGLNILIWAGYAASAHENPDVDRDGGSAEAERYLRTARLLLEEYRLP